MIGHRYAFREGKEDNVLLTQLNCLNNFKYSISSYNYFLNFLLYRVKYFKFVILFKKSVNILNFFKK